MLGTFLGWVALFFGVVATLVFIGYRLEGRRKSVRRSFGAYAWETLNRPRYRLPVALGGFIVPFLLTGAFAQSPFQVVGALGITLVTLGVSLLTFAIPIAICALIVWALWRMAVNANKPTPVASIPELAPFCEPAGTELAAWGATPEERLEKIREFFARGTGTVSAKAAYSFIQRYQTSEGGGRSKAYLGFAISRNLSAMPPKARFALMATEMLAASGGDLEAYGNRRRALIWGDGAAVIDNYTYSLHKDPLGIKDAKTMIDWYMGQRSISQEAIINRILQVIDDPQSTTPLMTSVKDELRAQLGSAPGTGSKGDGGGGAWLSGKDIPSSVFAARSQHAVQIGVLEDGTPLTFSGDESLITIAPPGSGKTQCNVFPTLLRWKGPALVLDISGDIYDKTSKWRSENVGPVYKFSPLDPERSHRWSPLSFVRSSPDYIWEDSRLLAELMIVPGGSKEPFWEDNARIFLTAAIAATVYTRPPEDRPMHEVLDAMHGGEAWESMLTTLRLAVDVRAMPQHATSIAAMQEKTREDVRLTARSSLAAWAGERVARATSGSDWNPMELRAGGNATVYIVVQPHEVEAYLSLLRVFIGQHIRMLFSSGAPKHGSCPTLIMLDEMPRLRKMPPIDEALNIGRRFGLRLWMFAQSFGQLEEAYENAEGMVASCGVRIYMNPSAADGTAEKLAEQIGYRSGPMDGNRQLIVEPNVLSGAAFKDHQIVLGKGCKPAKVRKVMAWQDPEISGRFGELEVTRTAAGGGR